jgi:hypothetical protein
VLESFYEVARERVAELTIDRVTTITRREP